MEQYVLPVEQCRELVQLGLDMNNAKLCWDNEVDCISFVNFYNKYRPK